MFHVSIIFNHLHTVQLSKHTLAIREPRDAGRLTQFLLIVEVHLFEICAFRDIAYLSCIPYVVDEMNFDSITRDLTCVTCRDMCVSLF